MAIRSQNPGPVDDGSPIAIISGYGSLPAEVAHGAVAAGRRPFLIGLEGEADPSIEAFDHEYINLGQLGAMFKIFKDNNISQLVMAGGIHARPEIFKLKLDWGAITSIPKAMGLLLNGDDTLLSGVIKFFEDRNIQVLGAHEVAPQLLASAGQISGKKPNKKDMQNIKLAARACHWLGKLDIGQAAIAEANRIIAVEGVEGTDGLIERVIELRKNGRMPPVGKNGVLVKMMKPGQDHRADMPAIGPNTVIKVKEAGLCGIAIDSGKSLILNKENTLKLAKENNIYLYGYQSPEDDSGDFV